MFLVIVTFILAVGIPFGLRVAALPHALADRIVVAVVAVALAIVGISIAWRMFASRSRGVRVRVPDANRLTGLNWPRDLTRAELEGYCTAYLRAQGWQVTPVLAAEAEGTYLEATRPGSHALLLCEAAGSAVSPALVRSVALAATGFEGAQPGVLTLTRDAFLPPVVSAARVTGVMLLHVPDLPQLADLVGTPQRAIAATAAH